MIHADRQDLNKTIYLSTPPKYHFILINILLKYTLSYNLVLIFYRNVNN